MAEAKYQISDKLDDGAIFLVRGDSYAEFSNNIDAVIGDESFATDINRFLNTVRGSKPATEAQAQSNVIQAFPQAQVQQQSARQFHPAQYQPAPQQQYAQPAPWDLPQAGTNANTFTCEHGQRVEKSGQSKNGGTWTGWFCPVKATGCKPMGSDGKLWK